MVKPSNAHIPLPDYLRGVAILSVVFFHALGASFGADGLPWDGWFRSENIATSFFAVLPVAFGFIGVPIFFVISGFCIHIAHRRSHENGFGAFFLRRFFRIYPPYLAALLFFAFLFPPTHAAFINGSYGLGHPMDSIRELLTHLFLVHNLSNSYCFGTINPAFWSIAVEAQLYLLYPVLLALTARLGWRRTLLFILCIELGLHAAEAGWILHQPTVLFSRAFTNSPFSYWFSWAIGAGLAHAYLKGETLPFRGTSGVLWPALLICTYFFRPLNPFMFTMAALTTATVMAHGLPSARLNAALAHPRNFFLQHLHSAGIVSYSAYLIHQPFLRIVPGIVRFLDPRHHPSALVIFVICLLTWIPIYGLSWLAYRHLELPSIAWGRRILDRQWQRLYARHAHLLATHGSRIIPVWE